MPRKLSDKTHGEKIVWLFAELYFTGKPRSLIGLMNQMGCSKQTVTRLVDEISRAYVPIQETKVGKKSYYHIPRLEKLPRALSMTSSELTMLYMCQAFTKHLLGKEQLLESEKALQKSSTIAAGTGGADHFAVFLPGTIDYTPRQKDIRQLMRAMDERIVCKIVYKNAFEETEKTFYIKPYKLFSYNNALYLHAGMARYPGSKKFEFDFDPLLAVHRLQKVTLTEKGYDFPRNYNFEKQFNQTFGIIKEDAFKVKLELEGYAAVYAQERKFSPDQKIRINKDEKYILTFTASSEPEVLAWVLSHGAEVKVLSPEWLVEDVKEKVKAISKRYCNN